LSENFTYTKAGVNRELRAVSKEGLKIFEETYQFSPHGEVLRLPYGNLFPLCKDCYLDLVIEGVGTKVLIAQLAEKYDTIGIDAVAMAVNDVIRSGAKPLALADNIHAQISSPELVKEWAKGIARGACEAECVVVGGEIGDVAEIIKGILPDKGFDMVVACIGEVSREKIILGNNLQPGDTIIGLRSSGVHSNGITLARKVLFKKWGGKYNPYDVPESINREIVYEVLEPTRIYVKPLLKLTEETPVKAAVHITGDAYLKFERLSVFSAGIGFKFDNFKPQPIFELIQEAARETRGTITDEEMLKTFNMGWGFAVIIEKTYVEEALSILEKQRVEAEIIGQVTDSKRIVAFYKGKKLVLT
jgi:phosphoribosylformylglycinamidine cyclo-ligase